jgi:homoserine dehydrogenase
MKTLTVAVAGLGVVGRETVRLLRARRAALRERLGAELSLTAVCDRDAAREARALGLPASVARFTDPARMAREAPADLFVETMGGYGAPLDFARRVLGRGRSLITANKRLLAHAWPQLSGTAARRGARLAFEGSVAGGVPVLRALELSLSGDRLLGLDAILNGTTNYILSRCEEGVTPAEALREAQALGFAEKDPSLDLSGGDAAQKLVVLAGLATGGWLAPGSFPVEGIEAVEARDAESAKELGRAVRLVASLRLEGPPAAPRASAWVAPTLVPLGHPLAAVRRQYNALLVRAESAGDLMFYGQGAGAGPTASAVVADLLVTARDLLGGLPSPRPAPRTLARLPAGREVSGFYLRLQVADRPGALARLAGALGREGVSIASIRQDQARGARAVPVTITTHPAPHGRFEAARRRILALPEVARRHCAMRILA